MLECYKELYWNHFCFQYNNVNDVTQNTLSFCILYAHDDFVADKNLSNIDKVMNNDLNTRKMVRQLASEI